MKAKLSKDKDGSYTLSHHPSGWGIGSTNHEWVTNHIGEQIVSKLSLKNCQAIERGYDLEGLAEDMLKSHKDFEGEGFSDYQNGRLNGIYEGFQKALELMGDKKFSEEDVRKAMESMANLLPLSMIDNYIQSLQQTEWEVIVEMEDIQEIHVDGVLTLQPKLDAEGCLILKRL